MQLAPRCGGLGRAQQQPAAAAAAAAAARSATRVPAMLVQQQPLRMELPRPLVALQQQQGQLRRQQQQQQRRRGSGGGGSSVRVAAALSTGVSRPAPSGSGGGGGGGGGGIGDSSSGSSSNGSGGGAGAPPRAVAAAAPSAPAAAAPTPAAGAAAAPPSPSQQQQQRQKNGVLLLNLGGPETLADVRPFLYNLFADPDIIRLPQALKFLQPVLATVIATLRAPKSSEGYAAIGGGSPLRRITDEQAAALAGALRAKGLDAEVYVAMRYWHPYTEEALQHVVRDGVTNLVILPLYPQFSISTSGSSLRLLEALFKRDPVLARLKHTVIPSWYQRPGYVGAMVDLIERELDKFGGGAGAGGGAAGAAAAAAGGRGGLRDRAVVFFSAHGVPKSYVEEAGDPYKEEMEECVGLIMDELRRRGRGNDHVLAYQSRVGPVEWLQPYTDDSIRELGRRGVEALLAVPISFVSEHIETLEEIDVEYRELAMESGIKAWGRVPALNTNPRFIDDLADAVVEALPFVGVVAGAPSDSLVPMGDLDTLLDAYDRDRRTLPAPVEVWTWGWTRSAETWNGRIAMVAVLVILILESLTGQPLLNQLLAID